MKNQKTVTILLAVAVYLISTGISYTIFSNSASLPNTTTTTTAGMPTGSQNNDYEALEFSQSEPKTEECPLNGVKYSKSQKEWWSKHRPLGVMIENHEEARPQSGINAADVVYEAVAEGGITRFLTVFYCQDGGIVGPVRSARVYFLDFISEYGKNPLYAHVGGANTPGPANALGQIADMDWVGYNDMNQFSLGLPTFKRDNTRLGREVATEHTMYSSTSKLWAVAEKRGLTNVDKNGTSWDEKFVPYKFKEDQPSSGVNSIKVEYWKGYDNYAAQWTYNKKNNSYLRKTGGDIHMDRNTHKQLETKNVVLLEMVESNANDGYDNNLHLLYRTKGKGNAYIFMDGKEIKGTWQKSSRTDRLKLYTADGSEITFNRGKIWFQIVPTDGVVETE